MLLISGSQDAKQNILHKTAAWGWGQREYRGNRGKTAVMGTKILNGNSVGVELDSTVIARNGDNIIATA